jgi:ribosomal-protein-serine acetyltransferase
MGSVLSDDVIVIRPLEASDCAGMYAGVLESIPEVSRWLPWCHPAYSLGEAAAYIGAARQAWAASRHFSFGIFDATNGRYAGSVTINHIIEVNRLANCGYWVRTSCTRRGFATRAVRLAATFAFGTLGLTRLEIAAMPENLASRRVAEKAGARFEAIARNRIVLHGQAHPAAVYSLVPEDLRA